MSPAGPSLCQERGWWTPCPHQLWNLWFKPPGHVSPWRFQPWQVTNTWLWHLQQLPPQSHGAWPLWEQPALLARGPWGLCPLQVPTASPCAFHQLPLPSFTPPWRNLETIIKIRPCRAGARAEPRCSSLQHGTVPAVTNQSTTAFPVAAAQSGARSPPVPAACHPFPPGSVGAAQAGGPRVFPQPVLCPLLALQSHKEQAVPVAVRAALGWRMCAALWPTGRERFTWCPGGGSEVEWEKTKLARNACKPCVCYLVPAPWGSGTVVHTLVLSWGFWGP